MDSNNVSARAYVFKNNQLVHFIGCNRKLQAMKDQRVVLISFG